MIVYTFQSKEKYNELIKNGVIYGSEPNHVLEYWGQSFLDAYKYLSKQMNIHSLPIFGWPIKPDLRKGEFKPEKGKYLLKVRISNPTISHFMDYHCVLNKTYLAKNGGRDYDYQWNNPNSRKRIVSSWKRIFRKKPQGDVQITFEKILLKDVLEVRKV